MSTVSFNVSEDDLAFLPEGFYWVLAVTVSLNGRPISSGRHRYWHGICETNRLTKALLIMRIKEKRSIFTKDADVNISGWYAPHKECRIPLVTTEGVK